MRRILGWIAVGAVIAQGLLGGLTVLFLLPPAISIAHAGLAEIFLCLNVSIALIASKFFDDVRAMDKGLVLDTANVVSPFARRRSRPQSRRLGHPGSTAVLAGGKAAVPQRAST